MGRNPESPSLKDVLKLRGSSRYLGLAAACSEVGTAGYQVHRAVADALEEAVPTWG